MSETRPTDDAPDQPDFTLPLTVASPFNLKATVRLLQRRPANRVDRWEDDRYFRAFMTPDGVRLVAVGNAGTTDTPELRMEMCGGPVSAETAEELTAEARWMLGLDAAPAPTAWLAEMEPAFAPVAAVLRGFRAPCFPNLFETYASVLPFQQLSLDAGTAILGRIVARLGARVVVDGHEWFAFPGPEAIAESSIDLLREDGLSRTKAASLQTLARLALNGELTASRYQSLPTDTALAELRALPGVGPWSAALILLRGLRRMDVFPTGDVGAARNLAALLDLPARLTPAEASAFAARFGDRQGYLYFLGLGGQLLGRGLLP
jgi:DNA-3-methyladenine glycosylase II